MKNGITTLSIVLVAAAFPLCGGCLHHFTMMPGEALRQALQSRMSSLPSVAILAPYPDPDSGKIGGCSGSAVVLGERRLLLSRHQIAADRETIVVNGRTWSYQLVEAVDAVENEADGWVLLRLSKLYERSDEELRQFPSMAELPNGESPIFPSKAKQDQAAMEMPPPARVDFTSPVPLGTTIAFAYNRTYLESRGVSLFDPLSTMRIEKRIVTGRVCMRSFHEPWSGPFLRVDLGDDPWLGEGSSGVSGSPVYAWFRGQEEPVVIGVYAGIATWTSDRTGKTTTTQLVRRPHELVME